MKKVLKFVKGKKDDKKDGGITPSQSGDLISPAQTPEDERFLGLDNVAGYIVDFCGKDKTLTKLHKAAWQGNLDKVKNALKKVDIDAVDRHNRTALHFSVVQGHPNIVWFLLGNNARHTICDDEGRTALLKAVECCHKESMNLLLERGANVNHADFSGNTCVHIASKQGALEVAGTLLEKGADMDVANNSGEYPLHIAVRSQNKDMAQLLLQCGASVNSVDRENRTPLMLAAKTGNLLLTQLFLEQGAQLFVVDSNGWTAEDYALLGGYQAVASEIKALMKKDIKPPLETHAEEDETEAGKSDQDTTWNDSHLSDSSEPKAAAVKVDQFLRKFSVESDGATKNEKEEDLVESPGSGVVPPPCQPPRSWEIIEAGMIDEATAEGAEPKRRSITALGSLHSRKESFTDTSGSQSDGPKYTLSLNRRKDVKKSSVDVKHRFSFNEEESLKSSHSDDFSLRLKDDKEVVKHAMPLTVKEEKERQRNDSGSDWDSHLSSLLESNSLPLPKKQKEPVLKKEGIEGTLGRRETMNEVEELWVADQSFPDPPPRLPEKVEEETEVSSSSWDSGESFQNGTFPPPPTALELGVNMARSIKCMKGISIDQVPTSEIEPKIWRKTSFQEQSHSMDSSVDEKDRSEQQIEVNKPGSSKRHSRQPSFANHKWRSVELPQQRRPSNRLVDANRRISEQLECYDQALRELAESPYDKRQDAIISTLKEPKSSKIENYYSLPSSKLRRGSDFATTTWSGNFDFSLSLPPQFSLRSEVPHYEDTETRSLPLPEPPGAGEVENNETLGFEEKVMEKPNKLDLQPTATLNADNLESPMSDDLTGSDKSDRRSKRHILLAMRDIKHAGQVINSIKTSFEDQILSPLTKPDGEFDVSPNKRNQVASGSKDASPGDDHAFFRGDSQGVLGRQETVIERPGFQARSSPSDSGDEPTLWLQDKIASTKHLSAPTSDDDDDKRSTAFSPLGIVHKELEAERRAKLKRRSPDTSFSSDQGQGRRMPTSTLQRLQRHDSSSDNEESLAERKDKKRHMVDDIDCSPDLSFSSGPIEPLGKDSGSDPESSHRESTPVHQLSLKKHHKWLKEKLQNENKEKHQLEEVAAHLVEKAERLQYELADAREATKSRDEIIALLQAQLARMENAYTKSLEDSVHCRLQLTTLEQEILHLKELCAQYEEERENRGPEGMDKPNCDFISKIRELEEEKEGLSRVVVRLEQENRTLERKNEETNKARWTERSGNEENVVNTQQENSFVPPVDISDTQVTLKRRNIELESQIKIISEVNKQLESRLDEILESRKLNNHEQINESILLLNKKNTELESQLQSLIEELRKSKRLKEDSSDSCQGSISEKKSIGNSQLNGKDCKEETNDAHVKSIQLENKVLTQTIEDMKEEINRLKNMPNIDLPNIGCMNEVLSKDCESNSEESDLLISEEKKLGNEIEELQQWKSDTVVPKEVEDLKKEVQGLKEALDEAKKGGVTLENQMNRLRTDSKVLGEEAKGQRENELAWSNLYGIKHVRQGASRTVVGLSTNGRPSQTLLPLDKDSEEFIEFKVRELEVELEKAKEEILRQRIESNMKMQEILAPKTDHLQVYELKNKVIDLEREVKDEKEARRLLDRRAIEIGFGLKDKRRIEFELDNIKSRIQREYVPKGEAEASKLQMGLTMRNESERKEMGKMDGKLLERCEALVLEQQRAEELERRLGRESEWREESWKELGRPKIESLTKERSAIFIKSTPCLDEDTKVKLTQKLEDSIKRYYESPVDTSKVTSPMKEDLITSQYLC